MAGREIGRLYEAAVQTVLPGYISNRSLPTTDSYLMSTLSFRLNFRNNPALRDYARSQLYNLRERIRVARMNNAPARNTRPPARRQIEPLPAGDHERRIELIGERFEHVGATQTSPNGRRTESIQYRSNYTRQSSTGGTINEFWRGAVRAIRELVQDLPHNQKINIHLSAADITLNAGSFTLSQLTSARLSEVAENIVQSASRVEPHDIIITVAWFPDAPTARNGLPASVVRGRGRVPTRFRARGRGRGTVRGRGKNRPNELKNIVGLQDAPSEGGLCGMKALVLGRDDWEKRSQGGRSQLLGPRSSLLRQARELARELGIPDNQDYSTTADFGTFVERHPEWRVYCVNRWRQRVHQGLWKGAAFDEEHLADGEYGQTIFVFYDERLRHFARIPNVNFNNFGIRKHRKSGRGDFKTCGHCLLRVKRASFDKHECEDRFHCWICRMWFSDDAWEKHTETLETECPRCHVVCGSKQCFDVHWNSCQGMEAHCYDCKYSFSAEELDEEGYPAEEHLCKWIVCPNLTCRKKLDVYDIATHRCFIAKCRPRKKGSKKRSIELVEEEAVEDDDEDEEDEDDDKESANVDLRDHWAWDSEARIEEQPSGRFKADGTEIMNNLQIVNYVVAINLADLGPSMVKKEFDNIGSFVEWAVDGDSNRAAGTKWVFWSHNGAKYDTRLVWDYAVNNMAPEDYKNNNTIVGNRLFEFKLANASFRDSYLHLGQRLSSLPKTLSLDLEHIAETLGGRELKKGFFPYKFNIEKNQNYVGPLPPLKYYEPERRKSRDVYKPSEEDQEGVIEWHARETLRVGDGWDFQKELREYCIMDTLILAHSLVKWRSLNIDKEEGETKNCDPLAAITLPGHAHKTFRTFHLKPNTIPVLKCFNNAKLSGDPAKNEEALCRKAYYGGNTNCRRLLLELTDEQMEQGHRIAMYDFRSQYPAVMINHEYPVGDYYYAGYTTWRQPALEYLMGIHGIICCEVEFPDTLPPLFHPILPRKNNGKLTFDLCKCDVTPEEIDHYENSVCDCAICHRLRQREPPVYTLVEFHKAIKHGYRLIHVYWVLGTDKVSTTLFNSYIGTNYKLKTRSAKPPSGMDFDDPFVCREFIQKHKDIDVDIEVDLKAAGITLKEWFSPNDGQKEVAKKMLNSQYGKMGENSFRATSKFVHSREEEEALWNQDGFQLRILNRVSFANTTEYRISEQGPGRTIGTSNVMIAAYITAYGRDLLWELCNKYGEDVLYHDTDSAIIHIRPGVEPPKTGPYLGELEEEISNAQGFVATGPKSYAIKSWIDAHPSHYADIRYTKDELMLMDAAEREAVITRNGDGILRWNDRRGTMEFGFVKQRNKGIVLNAHTEAFVNYKSMRDMVQKMVGLDESGVAEIMVDETRFVWDKESSIMYTTEGTKTFSADRDILKGKLAADFYTLLPFGAERFPQWQLLES